MKVSYMRELTYSSRWIQENQAGHPVLLAMHCTNAKHQIEQVGKELRSMMLWLNPFQTKAENAEAKVETKK